MPGRPRSWNSLHVPKNIFDMITVKQNLEPAMCNLALYNTVLDLTLSWKRKSLLLVLSVSSWWSGLFCCNGSSGTGRFPGCLHSETAKCHIRVFISNSASVTGRYCYGTTARDMRRQVCVFHIWLGAEICHQQLKSEMKWKATWLRVQNTASFLPNLLCESFDLCSAGRKQIVPMATSRELIHPATHSDIDTYAHTPLTQHVLP